VTLSVRRHDIDALPDAVRQVTILTFPTLAIHLHEHLERVRQARQVRLCGRIPKSREGDGDREPQDGRGVSGGGDRARVGGVKGRGRERGGYAEERWETQMRYERWPSAGASYRCSLALSDEAFS